MKNNILEYKRYIAKLDFDLEYIKQTTSRLLAVILSVCVSS